MKTGKRSCTMNNVLYLDMSNVLYLDATLSSHVSFIVAFIDHCMHVYHTLYIADIY